MKSTKHPVPLNRDGYRTVSVRITVDLRFPDEYSDDQVSAAIHAHLNGKDNACLTAMDWRPVATISKEEFRLATAQH